MTSSATTKRNSRRQLLLGGIALATPFLWRPREAFACHEYVSPVDGQSGCGAYRRDRDNGSYQDGSSSSGSSGSSSGGNALPAEPSCPPASDVAGGDASRPYLGRQIGCHIYGGGVGNNRFSAYHAYRFRCEYGGNIKSMRWWNRFDWRRPGYHTGNGGRLSIEIHSDSGGNPSGQVLTSTEVIVGPANIDRFPEIAFRQQARLSQGTVYHIVFRQHAPDEGTVSINDVHCFAEPQPRTGYDYWKDSLASMVYGNGRWRVLTEQIPIFELYYTDGTVRGQSWMNGGRSGTSLIEGSSIACQEFRPDGSRSVASISLCAFHKSGSGDLQVQLRDDRGSVLDQAGMACSQLAQIGGDYRGQGNIRWATVALPRRPTISAGRSYSVWLSAPWGTQFGAITAQKGTIWGFRDPKLSTVGYAWRSDNNGASWSWWRVDDIYDREQSLPMMLDFA
ncbi:hypothetical protein [Marinimicrococcus flavescens]|uniref:Uncharacterized protein n=1 Tax=Marinimicrococcus flavescens TaxID=3031815 RepID=A0AAP3V2Y5_9PROT|nr:hypothetical protein [Marinimicrococcus flavescens]